MGAPLPAGQAFCTHCGAAQSSSGQFCQLCGWALGQPSVPLTQWGAPGVGFLAESPSRTSDHVVLIVVIVIAAVIVVPTILALVLFGVVSSISTGPGTTPLGTAFAAGSPTPGTCSAPAAANGACTTSGDWTYQLAVESSTVTLRSVLFEVIQPSGAVFRTEGPASFALVTTSGVAVATAQLSPGALQMESGWTTYRGGYSAGSLVSQALSIEIDMGQSSPTTGLGLAFVAQGANGYSGTTSPLTLP
jgi:hypothetical protein